MAPNISGGIFKHIEAELHRFHESRKELHELRSNLIHQSQTHESTNKQYKDPTGAKAIDLADNQRIQHLEKMVQAIHSVYETLPNEKKRLVQLLYWTKPQKYSWEGIAHQLYISKRQAQRWRKSIVEEIANHLGWK